MIDGAAVRVSLVCFSRIDDDSVSAARLDGQPVDEIYADLTARRGGAGVDLTMVRRLSENANVAFMGDTKGGPFDVAGDQARAWLRLPANPNGRTNADVLKPWVNGMDLTRRPAGKWIVDFGLKMSAEAAALYEEPFRWVKDCVHPMRQRNRRDAYRAYWWRHVEPRQGMWRTLDGLSRYIATPTVAKHRLFVWCDARICPDHQLIVIARDDDTTFGILHSRFHEVWSLRLCTWLGKGNDPRYTPTTTFETFPFPRGLAPHVIATDYAANPRAAAISDAAQRLDEPVPGYPTRPVPRDEAAATALKTRTLTSLYNARPTWLADAHAALDAAVATAYGWPADISDDDAPATAALAVAAVRFRAKLAGQPDPAGEATARVLGGYRRTAADRGQGQAAPLRADGLAAILATAERPRTDGRGVESTTTAQRRGRTDAVIAGLLFMGGLRRSEVAALRWADVTDATDGDGVLVTVRTSKTNQEGDAADVRYLKNGGAKAIRTLRAAAADAAPTDRVIGLSPLQIQRRFTAAARGAGIEARVTAHSGRVGLASELTARGASTTEVMLAGNWRTSRMVAHYSAGATAERGAVAKYL